MNLATECRYNGKIISIQAALVIRDANKSLVHPFQCTACGQLLRAHRRSKTLPSHFKHRDKKAVCEKFDDGR